MQRKWKPIAAALLLTSVGGLFSQTQGLPTQDIVLVIDNSGSMESGDSSDPLRLRGVAAGLILDTAELYSRISAGLVFFNDDATVAANLGEPDQVRLKIRGDRLPKAKGHTNMRAALEAGLAMLTGSTAQIKRIVLITDGTPDSGTGPAGTREQIEAILNQLVPEASQAGVKIFALGLSKNVNEPFLTELTGKTGGATEIGKNHDELLESAKDLFSDRDNVYTLDRLHLGAEQSEVSFEIPPGADRARVTAILDRPNVFSSDELTWTLSGPDSGDGGQSYLVPTSLGDRVAAWTAFVSAPGNYKLAVVSIKPGVPTHLGLNLFVEALSTLHVELLLSPSGKDQFVFGEDVRLDVLPSSGSGALPPGSVRVSGEVRMPSGSVPIAFNGLQGSFKVPDLAGHHEIVVKIQTSGKLGRADAKTGYRALPPQPVELKASRERIPFVEALGPEHTAVEESFKIYAVSAEGSPRDRVDFSVTLATPAGLGGDLAEVVSESGRTLQVDGAHRYPLPAEGLELTLRFKMDATRPFPVEGGERRGEIRIQSNEATNELVIPFVIQVRIPRLSVPESPAPLSLWWDPERTRIVGLGSISTDAALDSQLAISLPEELSAPDQGPKIAELSLDLPNGVKPDPNQSQAGRVTYGLFPLPQAQSVPLRLEVRPAPGWENLPRVARKVLIEVRSSLGMRNVVEPTVWTLGGPLLTVPVLGPFSLHGRHLATWLLIGGGALWIFSRALSRLRKLVSIWGFRPGSSLQMGFGTLRFGDNAAAGAALALPNSGGDLDDQSFGSVSRGPKGIPVMQDGGGSHLFVSETPARQGRALGVGDSIAIREREDDDPVWEFEYVGPPLEEEAGEIEVIDYPLQFTLGRILRRLAAGCVSLLVLKWILSTGWMAGLAYRVPMVDAFYTAVLLPFFQS